MLHVHLTKMHVHYWSFKETSVFLESIFICFSLLLAKVTSVLSLGLKPTSGVCLLHCTECMQLRGGREIPCSRRMSVCERGAVHILSFKSLQFLFPREKGVRYCIS